MERVRLSYLTLDSMPLLLSGNCKKLKAHILNRHSVHYEVCAVYGKYSEGCSARWRCSNSSTRR